MVHIKLDKSIYIFRLKMHVTTLTGQTHIPIPTGESNQQTFQFEHGQCLYYNSIKQNDGIEDDQTGKSLQITNQISRIKKNITQKVTVIRFNNQQIQIIDNYCFGAHGSIDFNELLRLTNPKRLHLFKNSDSLEETGKSYKIIKNLAKNFIRGFEKYLIKGGTTTREFRKLKLMIMKSKHKYNNQLLQKVLENSVLVGPFEEFLEGSARLWIESSKIMNKQAHYDVIEMLINIIRKQNDCFQPVMSFRCQAQSLQHKRSEDGIPQVEEVGDENSQVQSSSLQPPRLAKLPHKITINQRKKNSITKSLRTRSKNPEDPDYPSDP